MTTRTVLIGLDGATFSVLDPLMKLGVMPFLSEFIADGVRAPLRSVIPPLTPPAWTSLMTGKRPGQHGVFDFFQKEAPDSRYFRLSTSSDIRSETIWTLASAHGLRVTALNFPQMFPPPSVSGSVVPGGWMPWRQLRLGCHPPGLFDRLKALPSFDAKELAMDTALEEKALEGCDAEEYAGWVALHIRRELRWFDVLALLMDEDPADLTAVLFDGVDKLQHLCWRFLDPDLRGPSAPSWEIEVARLCEGYFRQLDGLIAGIVERAGPEAAVVLASDHGFGPSRDIFFINTWLEQNGFLAWAKNEETGGESQRVGIGHIARHVFEMDWDRTVAYAATPSGQGIQIVTRGPETPGGVTPEAYGRVRDAIVEGLRRLRHPETGRPVVAEIWTREAAFAGPFEEFGPDITVLLEENAVISILRSEDVIKRRADPVGTHHPSGVFMARGPGIHAGLSLPEISILDVAPLILHLLGIPIPSDVTGRLPVEALTSRHAPSLSRWEPEAVESEDDGVPVPDDPDLAYDEEEEAVVLKRLKALGYLE